MSTLGMQAGGLVQIDKEFHWSDSYALICLHILEYSIYIHIPYKGPGQAQASARPQGQWKGKGAGRVQAWTRPQRCLKGMGAVLYICMCIHDIHIYICI